MSKKHEKNLNNSNSKSSNTNKTTFAIKFVEFFIRVYPEKVRHFLDILINIII